MKRLSVLVLLLSYAANAPAGGWYRYEPSGAEWRLFFGIAAVEAFADVIADGATAAYEGIKKIIHPVQGQKSYLCIKGDLGDLGYHAGKLFGNHLDADKFKDRAIGFVADESVEHGRHAAWICKRMAGLSDNETVSVIRQEDRKLSYIGKGERPSSQIAQAFAKSTARKGSRLTGYALEDNATIALAISEIVNTIRS
jgi:hypothetical protein